MTPLPALAVIREKFSFCKIVAAAGLTVAERSARRLMPRSAAVTLFVQHCGFLPTQADLAWFARHHRLQLVDRTRESHRAAIHAAREAAAREGRSFPASRPSAPPADWQRRAACDSAALAEARRDFPAARKAGYSLDEIHEAIGRAFDLVGPGEAVTQERYRALSTEHGLPSPSVIQRLGRRHETSFGTLVREVATARAQAVAAPEALRPRSDSSQTS